MYTYMPEDEHDEPMPEVTVQNFPHPADIEDSSSDSEGSSSDSEDGRANTSDFYLHLTTSCVSWPHAKCS